MTSQKGGEERCWDCLTLHSAVHAHLIYAASAVYACALAPSAWWSEEPTLCRWKKNCEPLYLHGTLRLQANLKRYPLPFEVFQPPSGYLWHFSWRGRSMGGGIRPSSPSLWKLSVIELREGTKDSYRRISVSGSTFFYSVNICRSHERSKVKFSRYRYFQLHKPIGISKTINRSDKKKFTNVLRVEFRSKWCMRTVSWSNICDADTPAGERHPHRKYRLRASSMNCNNWRHIGSRGTKTGLSIGGELPKRLWVSGGKHHLLNRVGAELHIFMR